MTIKASSQNQPTTVKGASTRERIVIVARQRLIQNGIENFALREIADSLGIKLGNLQYYFQNKEALILHVLEAEAAKDRQIIDERLDQDASAQVAFRHIVSDLTSRWRGESGILFSTLGTLAMHNKEYAALYRKIYLDFYQALELPLRKLKPELDTAELQMRSRLITALIDGAPMQPRIPNKTAFIQRVQDQAESIALA